MRLFSKAAPLFLASLLLFGCKKEPPPAPAPTPSELSADATFTSFLVAGFPEQDVFISAKRTSKTVSRTEPQVSEKPDLLALEFRNPAYASTDPLPHDFFKTGKNPLGPYPKGKSLRITFVQWLNARGQGKYTVQNGRATLKAQFSSRGSSDGHVSVFWSQR